MNSRQRRKLEAQQHNDEINYTNWLRENAIYNRPKVSVMGSRESEYVRARKAGMSVSSALIAASIIMSYR